MSDVPGWSSVEGHEWSSVYSRIVSQLNNDNNTDLTKPFEEPSALRLTSAYMPHRNNFISSQTNTDTHAISCLLFEVIWPPKDCLIEGIISVGFISK